MSRWQGGERSEIRYGVPEEKMALGTKWWGLLSKRRMRWVRLVGEVEGVRKPADTVEGEQKQKIGRVFR